MKNFKNSLNHIRDTETKNTVKDFIYKCNIYEKDGRDFHSNFLNPAEFKYAVDIVDKYQFDYNTYGGRDDVERKIISVGYLDEEDIFDIVYIEGIDQDIGHRDVLGAIINLGIDRSDIGDIVFNADRIEIAIIKNSSSNIVYNLNRINKMPVEPKIKESTILQKSGIEDIEMRASISSLRLDSIVAAFINTSRSKAQLLIKSGRVKLNHIIENAVDAKVDELDIISVSGKGRFQLTEIGGLSKKGRVFIEFIKKG
ncbi:MAG: YlmH/Sll1252 family protein [Tissierellia bacterium]|nr:YlmH/Sll1252 family protein [Tissierellia bacterium]